MPRVASRTLCLTAINSHDGGISWRLSTTFRDYAPGGRDEYLVMASGKARTTGRSAGGAAIDVLLAALEQLGYDPSEADARM